MVHEHAETIRSADRGGPVGREDRGNRDEGAKLQSCLSLYNSPDIRFCHTEFIQQILGICAFPEKMNRSTCGPLTAFIPED